MKRKWWMMSCGVSILIMFTLQNVVVSAEQEVREEKDPYLFVQLESPPISTYQGGVKGYPRTMPLPFQKINVEDNNVKHYRRYLEKEQEMFITWIVKHTNACVVGRYVFTVNGVAIKAISKDIEKIKKGPHVKKVLKSHRRYPSVSKVSNLIHAPHMEELGYDGEGVKVAVIDDGIDPSHPFLQDSTLSMPAGFPKLQCDAEGKPVYPNWQSFVSNKVIVAKVFSPFPNATPKAVGSHGTHIAGIIAGRDHFRDPSGRVKGKLRGVAPKAYLGNYCVFVPGKSGENYASDIFIAKAIEEAVNDGMDVASLSLSLGQDVKSRFDMLVEVIRGATEAGMTVVVSGGNKGPNLGTIRTPGVSDHAITVGSVGNAHLFGKLIQVTVDGEKREILSSYIDPSSRLKRPLQAPLVVVTEGNGRGCLPISADLTGKVAVMQYGTCKVAQKEMHARERGAVGVLLVHPSPAKESVNVENALNSPVIIPVFMITQEVADWISQGQDAAIQTEVSEDVEMDTADSEYVSDFSSRGPTLDYGLKPDLVAVGAHVYSSVLGDGFASKSGTSMAVPQVSGAAAILLQAHPDWNPTDVKSALIGTARDPKSASLPLEVGGGILDIKSALFPVALAYPASVSFGKITTTRRDVIHSVGIRIRNMTSSWQMYTVHTPDANLKLDKSYMVLQRGGEGILQVMLCHSPPRKKGHYQGYITICNKTGKQIRIPYYYYYDIG